MDNSVVSVSGLPLNSITTKMPLPSSLSNLNPAFPLAREDQNPSSSAFLPKGVNFPSPPQKQHQYCRHKPPHFSHHHCTAGTADCTANAAVDAMAPSTNEDLNPEPSQPAQRKEHRLPPKTYAAATEENLDVQIKKENIKGEVRTVTSSTATQPNGQGKDDASQSSGRTTPTQYVGRGENEAPRSPTPKSHRRPKSNGSLRANGHKTEEEPAKSIEERYKDKDGEMLTSIKPATDYETAVVPDETRLPGGKKDDNQALVSGRQAGAGWEMSGYAISHRNTHLDPLLTTMTRAVSDLLP